MDRVPFTVIEARGERHINVLGLRNFCNTIRDQKWTTPAHGEGAEYVVRQLEKIILDAATLRLR